MSGPRFAARLLARPGFADEAEFRLDEAAGKAETLRAAIDAAVDRLSQGAPPKQTAFELVAEHPAVQVLAALAEVEPADRAYIFTALDTPDAVRDATRPLIAALDAQPGLQAGLGEAMPGLSEIRLIGPRFEVDFAGLVDGPTAKAAETLDLVLDGPRLRLRAVPPIEQLGLWQLVEWSLVEAVAGVLAEYDCLPLAAWAHPPTLSVGLESDLLVRPARSRLLQQVMAWLVGALEASGRRRAAAQAIVQAIPARFELGLAAAASGSREALSSADVAMPADPLGALHAAELRAAVWRPVLGQPFALPQIYVPPRGRTIDEDRDGSVLVDVSSTLDRWLAGAHRSDAIRVVSGAPGAGKSSLARMYAAARSRAPGTTLYVPLHGFDLTDDFRDAIRGQWPDFDPFAPDRGPLLLILDGLDEFALRGSAAAGSVRRLVDAVCRTAELLNQERAALRVILLGREMVVQGISDRFRKPGQIIHLLPLRLDADARPRLADPDGLADADLRHVWWRRYGAVTGEALDGVPPELDTPAFEPLTREPLLDLLLAVARKDGLLPAGEAELSRGELYQRLIRQVFDRVHAEGGPKRVPGVEAVEFDDYTRFLWTIAEAAWHGAGRTATVDDIRRRANPRLLERLHALTKGAEDPVSRLMTAFYFREHRGVAAEQQTFEFTHQSFAEHLLACRILDFLDLLDEERARYDRGRGGWSADEGALRWYRLFGPAPLEQNVIDFLAAAVRGRGPEVAARWQDRAAAILAQVVERSFPVEQGERFGIVEEDKRAFRAGGALLIVAALCAEVTRRHTSLPRDPAGYRWLESIMRLQHAASTTVRRYLTWLDLRGSRFLMAGWSSVSLDHGLLDDANFGMAQAIGARLVNCSLRNATLRGSRWLAVDFSHADLTGARFGSLGFPVKAGILAVPMLCVAVRFHGANLTDARLRGVIFRGCTADAHTIWPEGFDPVSAGIEIETD